jgi:hypothetical protein
MRPYDVDPDVYWYIGLVPYWLVAIVVAFAVGVRPLWAAAMVGALPCLGVIGFWLARAKMRLDHYAAEIAACDEELQRIQEREQARLALRAELDQTRRPPG